MRDEDLFVIGGIALMVLLGRRPRVVVPPAEWGPGRDWHWPVPDLITAGVPPYPSTVVYPATISQEFRDDHLGVDIAYHRIAAGDRPEYTLPQDSEGLWFAPPATPIVAARDGVVWSVEQTARGLGVVISHAKPFATFYQHLASTTLPVHTFGKRSGGGEPVRVKAGDVIGKMGSDPTDPAHFRHLHFAVWYKGAGDAASVDPAYAMRQWTRSTWNL